MSINLIIDTNEKGFIKDYYKENVDQRNVEFRKLDIGDIIIEHGGSPLVVIERKTKNDLASSIVSGRYREQKIRLLALRSEIPHVKVCYLIENLDVDFENNTEDIFASIKNVKRHINNNTLISSIVNTIFRDNLFCLKTCSIEETILFINKIYDKINGNLLHGILNKKVGDPEMKTYLDAVKIKKSKNITGENCVILQLMQIPGVSKKMATEISKEYTSMMELCLKYNSLENEKDKMKLLLPCKGVGSKISKRIYKYIHGETEN